MLPGELLQQVRATNAIVPTHPGKELIGYRPPYQVKEKTFRLSSIIQFHNGNPRAAKIDMFVAKRTHHRIGFQVSADHFF